MTLRERIQAFADLGHALRECIDGRDSSAGGMRLRADEFHEFTASRHLINEWFTPGNVRMAIDAIAGELTYENLDNWCRNYPGLDEKQEPKVIGVIMAGNIPLAGFHDMLSVLITGNILAAKTSSKDAGLTRYISELLVSICPAFRNSVRFAENELSDFDAVIATGSDNSSRYFEYYFGRYPHIIRKNRNSIAIIRGNENQDEIFGLGKDIFSYFGLGCRNVSKIFIPEGYDTSRLTDEWSSFGSIISHRKYANNYDFNKAVYIVNREPFTDTGYMLLKRNEGLSSPVGVLYYDIYTSEDAVRHQVSQISDRIQCISGSNEVPFGQAQSPRLWDYADGIDTIQFLLKKNSAGIL